MALHAILLMTVLLIFNLIKECYESNNMLIN